MTSDSRNIYSQLYDIVIKNTGYIPKNLSPFGIGRTHQVYLLETSANESLIVRVNYGPHTRHLSGQIFWTNELLKLGLAVPKILTSDLSKQKVPFAYTIYKKIEGKDLVLEYSSLKRKRRKAWPNNINTYRKKYPLYLRMINMEG